MNPFLLEHSEEELRLTSEFQSHIAGLSEISLKSFSARRTGRQTDFSEGVQLDLKHHASHCAVEHGGSCFEVAMTLDALADRDPDKPLFHVDCVFELVCTLEPSFAPTEEQLTAFEHGNAIFLCWPYMRELVQNATARLGLLLPPIPMLRVVPQSPAASKRPRRKAPKR